MFFRFKILPSYNSRWRTVAVFITAIFTGLFLFMAKEAEVTSYLGDNPQTCVNCHVMTPVYNSWLHSSHRENANCNDCHVPHNNVVNKYYFKAKDGLYHAAVFTTRTEPDVITMKEASAKVVQQNCIRCHIQQVTQTKYASWIEDHNENRTTRRCWECHKEVPHGRAQGISTVRYNIAPLPSDTEETVVPEWLETELKNKQEQ